MKLSRCVAAATLALTSSPALAHPGDHADFTFSTLGTHLLEPDHLISIALLVLLGVLAYGAGTWLGGGR